MRKYSTRRCLGGQLREIIVSNNGQEGEGKKGKELVESCARL